MPKNDLKEYFIEKLSAAVDKDTEITETSAAFIVAYSGGPDSQALLHALSILKHRGHKKIKNKELFAAHFIHGWRPGADEEEDVFCRKEAGLLGADYISRTADEISFEAKRDGEELPESAAGETAARMYRLYFYKLVLNEIRKKRPRLEKYYILTAHHADDRVESFLINLFRGSGIKGLTALPTHDGYFYRPLNGFNKNEIMHFLNSEGIKYISDPGNNENFTARNSLRNEFIPGLEREFPQLGKNVLSFMNKLEDIDKNIITECANNKLSAMNIRKIYRCGAEEFFSITGKELKTEILVKGSISGFTFNKSDLEDESGEIRFRIWRHLISELGIPLKDLEEKHFDRLSRSLSKNPVCMSKLKAGLFFSATGKEVYLWKDYSEISNEPSVFYIDRGCDEDKNSVFTYACERKFTESEEPWSEFVNACRLMYNFSVPEASEIVWGKGFQTGIWRQAESKDYVLLSDGGRKSVNKFMAEQGVPAGFRKGVSVYAEGNEIFVIPGIYYRKRI